jgi:hypothetical protein
MLMAAAVYSRCWGMTLLLLLLLLLLVLTAAGCGSCCWHALLLRH